MKVLLTTPITAFVEEPPNIPDLGLGYLATSLKNSRHQVYIRDWNMNPRPEDFEKWLLENCPEVIGIKVFTKDVKAAKKTISIIRRTITGAIIVIGGPHPSAAEPIELMEDFAGCDFAIRGEAEISFPLLLAEISRAQINNCQDDIWKERAKEIPGLVWRTKEKIYFNNVSLIDDLDKIGFPFWEMINPNNYSVNMFASAGREGAAAPIVTTRGCPAVCSFCSAYKISGRRIRYRNPSNVLEEISMLYEKYNVRKFMFQDNCFTSHKANLINLCRLIIDKKMDIEWDCVSYEKLDNLTDETLSLMYQAGCRMIHIGIESGSDKTRKVMKKSCALEEITKKVEMIRRNGIKVGAWFIVGFPEETEAEMKKTIHYAFLLEVDLITFTICFPLPGSGVYEYIKGKYNFDKIDWADFDIYNSVFPVSEVPSRSLTRLLKVLRLRMRINSKIRRLKSMVVKR